MAYKEFKCSKCSRLLFKGLLVESKLEIKCKKCGEMNIFTGEGKEEYICMKSDCPNRIK